MKDIKPGNTGISHAYIASGAAVDRLVMAAVCSSPGGGSGKASGSGMAGGGGMAGGSGKAGGGGKASGSNAGGGGMAGGGEQSTGPAPSRSINPCNSCNNCRKAKEHIHPDVMYISREKNQRAIQVGQIRALKKDVYIIPVESQRKVYIVNDAETMNVYAQNAFLKMLEEPPAHAVFILNTANPAALLPTVLSRCVAVRPDITQKKEPAMSVQDYGDITRLAAFFVSALSDNTNMQLAECMFALDEIDRNDFTEFITAAREQLVAEIRGNPRFAKAITADSLLMQAGEMLELNVSTGHISGMICASLMYI